MQRSRHAEKNFDFARGSSRSAHVRSAKERLRCIPLHCTTRRIDDDDVRRLLAEDFEKLVLRRRCVKVCVHQLGVLLKLIHRTNTERVAGDERD